MEKNQYIKSPLNYTGGKYKLLDILIPTFPSNISTFVDLFAGGGNVGINVDANEIIMNDQITYLVELYRYLQAIPYEKIIGNICDCIKKFNLSKENREGYVELRRFYNESKEKNPLLLFVLTCYSFNHQIRFNNSHEFNATFGKSRSSYNSSIENNLIAFCNALKAKNVKLSNLDFRSVDMTLLDKNSFVYCDPPYLLSTSAYNDGNRGFKNWTASDDMDLFGILDELNRNHIKFALSNVLQHKGQYNEALMRWSENYNVYFIDKSYENCSYNLKDRTAETVEVFITNY